MSRKLVMLFVVVGLAAFGLSACSMCCKTDEGSSAATAGDGSACKNCEMAMASGEKMCAGCAAKMGSAPKCASCDAAMASDGWCADCNVGYSGGKKMKCRACWDMRATGAMCEMCKTSTAGMAK
ncbi:MAG: hypothetical protein HY722_08795 [Planctomycetes bacterium]|nr:hypothetical protein [Planctomycetota bacterium]